MTKVIIVDDDPLACRILRRMLGPGYEVATFGNGEEALAHFTGQGADIIITDLKMPKMDGMELLAKAKAVKPEVIVFVITGFSSIDTAVAAIKMGAYDYIAKPFDPDDVLHRVTRALKEKQLEAKVHLLEHEKELEQNRYCTLTNHPKMLKVLDVVKKVARTDSTILIQGETGVGKELVARMIHQLSPRRENAFVAINCSALSEGVLESELFGHEKGAFTGAMARRVGFFELAHRGTILLDEIGTTDHKFQAKLLRVLQEKVIYRIGGSIPIRVDARVIAATNQDLEAESRTELFRSDLYYRLGVVTIRVPPLRERMEDIPLLARHFVGKYHHINPKVEDVSPEGFEHLNGYHYPGNIRELENIIERAMILETGRLLTPESILIEERPTQAGEIASEDATEESNQDLRMEGAEKEHILRVLELCNGKKLQAARMLGINKTTLWRKMKRYGMID